MTPLDIVVVSHNSSQTLRSTVEPLARAGEATVIVVDNASEDDSVDSVSQLPITVLRLSSNFGFAYGCNRGWEAGSAPLVLFLNPDCRIDPTSLRHLMAVLENDPAVGLVAPRLVDDNGSLDFSLRRFPRLRSTYAQALFLHRMFPRCTWADEVVRDPRAYSRACSVEWVSGACVLMQRRALEQLGGWNENFFLYGEDIDICRRLSSFGYDVRFEPSAEAIHKGGSSAPRAQLLPTLTASRLRYAGLHRGSTGALIERLGIVLGELTHAALTRKGGQARAGHLRALVVACSPLPALERSVDPFEGTPTAGGDMSDTT